MAGIAAMIAVSAMAGQLALLRLALPAAHSMAVMTGNLTSTVLALLDTRSPTQPLIAGATERLRGSLPLLIGFFGGCVVAAGRLVARGLDLVISSRGGWHGGRVALKPVLAFPPGC
jgi:hypothetical protein